MSDITFRVFSVAQTYCLSRMFFKWTTSWFFREDTVQITFLSLAAP